MKTIKIPKRVVGNSDGFEFLSFLAHEYISCVREEIAFDFSDCTLFEGNLCAVIGALMEGMILRKNELSVDGLNGSVRGAFFKNGFLPKVFRLEWKSENQGASVFYQKFKSNDEIGIKQYIENELLTRKELPTMSILLKKRIVTNIFEIAVNALVHGQSEEIFCCGQLYPRRATPIINFTLVDLGKTIKNNVIEFTKQPISGLESIKWASIEGNTTKQDTHSGGLGLTVLQKFIDLNGGRIQIVSADGFWDYSKDLAVDHDMEYNFPGTIVNLTFNVNDQSVYYLASESGNLGNIF